MSAFIKSIKFINCLIQFKALQFKHATLYTCKFKLLLLKKNVFYTLSLLDGAVRQNSTTLHVQYEIFYLILLNTLILNILRKFR